MNKMHALARIVFAALVIYIAVTFVPYMITFISMLFYQNIDASVIAWSLIYLLIVAIFMALLYYFLVRKRDQLAQKVVGTVEPSEPGTDIHWLTAALRLMCIVAGLISVYRVLIGIGQPLRIIHMILQRSHENFPFAAILNSFLGWLVLLPFGVYMLCGAPHFVRWQVKKTLEVAGQIKENTVDIETQ